MSAYAIVRIIDITDPATFETYKAKAGPTIGAHDGKVIVGGGRKATLEGDDDINVVIIEFPSYEAAEAWYNSPEYAEAMSHRVGAASAQVVLAEGR
jgi:uncharacterized protein (DUF1330 family)